MTKSLTQKTFLGFFWSTGGKIVNALMQIFVLAVLARLISPESFGLIQAALIVVGFAQLISKMGIGPALVQHPDLTERHIRAGFTFSLSLGVFLGIVMFFSSEYLASFFNIEGLPLVLKVVSLLFVFESFITVSTSLIEKEMRFKERAVVEMLSYIFGYGLVGVLFAYWNYDYWALIYAIFAQQIIKMVCYQIIGKHSFRPLYSKSELVELLYFGGGYTLGRFFNYIALQGDNIIAGRYLGAEALGLYSRAYTIMTKPVSLIGDSLDKVLFPAMAARQNDIEKLRQAFINGSKLITFISLLVSGIIVISSNEIVSILLGDNWTEAVLPLQILTLGLLFRMGYKMGDSIVRATGKVYHRAVRQFIYAFFMLAGSYVGSQYWGINGLAVGVVVAVFVNYFMMIGLGLKIISINWISFLKYIYQEVLLSFLLLTIFYFTFKIMKSLINNEIFYLTITMIAYGGVLLMLFYFYGSKLKFLKTLPFNNKLMKYTRIKDK